MTAGRGRGARIDARGRIQYPDSVPGFSTRIQYPDSVRNFRNISGFSTWIQYVDSVRNIVDAGVAVQYDSVVGRSKEAGS